MVARMKFLVRSWLLALNVESSIFVVTRPRKIATRSHTFDAGSGGQGSHELIVEVTNGSRFLYFARGNERLTVNTCSC